MASIALYSLLLLAVPTSGLQQHGHPNPPDAHHREAMRKKYEGPELNSSLNVWWLHVPKAGSSFANTVFGCSIKMPSHVSKQTVPSDSLKRNTWMFHRRLGVEMPDEELETVVMMVRKGDQRLASGFKEMQVDGEVFGLADGIGWGFESQKVLEDACRKAKAGKTPGNDESLRNFTGCQTNMVMGRGCMSGAVHDPSYLKEAERRLQKFFFVGLQDQWALSVCLFNYKATGERFVDPEQLSVARSNSKGDEYDTTGYPADDPDLLLYKAASKRFHAEIAEHKINKESCAHTRSGEPLWENDKDQTLVAK